MAKPLIFISHKHSDHAIATAIRSFINEQSKGTIRIFQSSDASAVGPKVARELNSELQRALWDAKAVILVYTTADKDWGYCLWECGVATLPGSPDTHVIVFQCAEHAPDVYSGKVRVDARKEEGLAPFVTQFMTAPDFLPDATEAITGYHADGPEVKAATAKFNVDLQAVLPRGEGSQWPAHPYLQIELSATLVDKLKKTPMDQRLAVGRAALEGDARISDSDSVGKKLFGLADFDPSLRFGTLLQRWKEAYPDHSDGWIDSLTEQVVRSALWEFPPLRWTSMEGVTDGKPHAPAVTMVRKTPSGSVQVDVQFFPFALLMATPVTARMVKRADMYCRVLNPGAEGGINILDLLREVRARGVNRIPMLDGADKVVYLGHRSVIDQFVSDRVTLGSADRLGEISLADMFTERPESKQIWSTTFCFAPLAATLDEVREAMSKAEGCRDVFITRTGDRDEPVLGWVTDVMIATGPVG